MVENEVPAPVTPPNGAEEVTSKLAKIDIDTKTKDTQNDEAQDGSDDEIEEPNANDSTGIANKVSLKKLTLQLCITDIRHSCQKEKEEEKAQEKDCYTYPTIRSSPSTAHNVIRGQEIS